MDVIDRGSGSTTRNGRTVLNAPVHQAPRASPSRSPATLPPSQQPFPSLAGSATRSLNVYVENPATAASIHGRLPSRHHTTNGVASQELLSSHTRGPVLTQPQPTIKKDGGSTGSTNSTVAEEQHVEACKDSGFCPQCNKCRCDGCTQRRPLPSRWLCDNKFECSLPRAVDCCSCLCCVRAVFYHCLGDSEGEEGGSISDDPCACCERPHCCKRWTCLGMFALCMPCLLLYWPLRCGEALLTSCYNRCTRRGCTCRRDRLPGSRRLLIDSESSSA